MFAFTTSIIPGEDTNLSISDILDAESGLSNAMADLTATQREMKEISDVIDNISSAISIVKTYGKEGINVVNLDKSLEHLLQIPSKLITAEKAQEGLGEAAKNAFAKLKEWILLAWNKLLEVVRKMYDWLVSKVDARSTADSASKLTPEQEKKLASTKINQEEGAGTEGFLDDSKMPKNKTLSCADTMDALRCITVMTKGAKELEGLKKYSLELDEKLKEDSGLSMPTQDEFTKDGEFQAERYSNKFIKCTYKPETDTMSAEWIYTPDKYPLTFAEAGWTKTSIIEFCRTMEYIKPRFKDYISKFEQSKTLIEQIIARIVSYAEKDEANSTKYVVLAKHLTHDQMMKYNFSIILVQKLWKLCGKIHWTVKEALYRATIEE